MGYENWWAGEELIFHSFIYRIYLLFLKLKTSLPKQFMFHFHTGPKVEREYLAKVTQWQSEDFDFPLDFLFLRAFPHWDE